MNQNIPPIIVVKNFMRPGTDNGLLIEHGKEVHDKLVAEIKKYSDDEIIYLSMKGISVVDASFSREAIIRAIKEFRCEKGFCLVDIDNEEYLVNFVAGVIKLKQPVFIKLPSGDDIIAPSYPNGPSKGNQQVLDYVKSHNVATATMLKSDFDLTITNASTKLKQLLEQGYLLRKQEIAASGGVEFQYIPIR